MAKVHAGPTCLVLTVRGLEFGYLGVRIRASRNENSIVI